MFQANQFRLRDLSHLTLCALFAAMFVFAFLAAATNSARAQEKLTPAQEQGMAKCLAPCKKGDAACQDSCSSKNSSPAFFKAAGSCVRACADALAISGQGQSHVDDLVHCVRACN